MTYCDFKWKSKVDNFQITCTLKAGHAGKHECGCGCGETVESAPEVPVIKGYGLKYTKLDAIGNPVIKPEECDQCADLGMGNIYGCSEKKHSGEHLFNKKLSTYPEQCQKEMMVGAIQAICLLPKEEHGASHIWKAKCTWTVKYAGAIMSCKKESGHEDPHHWQPFTMNAAVSKPEVLIKRQGVESCKQYKCNVPPSFRLRLKKVESQSNVEYWYGYCAKHAHNLVPQYRASEGWEVLGLIEADT